MSIAPIRFSINGMMQWWLIASLIVAIVWLTACGTAEVADETTPSATVEALPGEATTVLERDEIATAMPSPTRESATKEPQNDADPSSDTAPANPTATPPTEATGLPDSTAATDSETEEVQIEATTSSASDLVRALSQATSTPHAAVDDVQSTTPEREFDIITLLPPDAILALDNPGYYASAEQADESYDDDDLVLGIEINNDARAYSVALLSSHEIVNDVIGGEPVAVTW